MSNNLIIIGNGFDLHHGMKTSYSDYREFLNKTGNENIVNLFEENFEHVDKSVLWNELESRIGYINYENALIYLKSYGDENWKDSYHHDFQQEVSRLAGYWPGIKTNLINWVKTIQYTKQKDNLKKIIDNKSMFLCFNYTNTLEKLYSVEKRNINYIHGDYSKDNELIFGHNNFEKVFDWNIDGNEDEDIRLIEAGEYMEELRKDSLKQTKKIINKNRTFYDKVKNSKPERIYILGLSYNDIDYVYIEHINRIFNGKWFFAYYTDEDQIGADIYAERMGLKNYSLIKYEEI